MNAAALLHLDGTGGPVVNSMVMTAAAPGYSADGRPLVASSIVGTPEGTGIDEPAVRRELARIWAVPTSIGPSRARATPTESWPASRSG